MQQNKRRALQLAEKLIRGEFCNKGTALAGPQMQQNKGRALAPAGLSSESSPSFRGFSAACLAPAKSSGGNTAASQNLPRAGSLFQDDPTAIKSNLK
jgi:hypothetical protein